MRTEPVLLSESQRHAVEQVIREHAAIRGWTLHAVSARSNHVHIAVSAPEIPAKVRNQLKANATSILRKLEPSLTSSRIWAKGGDIELITSEESLDRVVGYVSDAQEKMGQGKH